MDSKCKYQKDQHMSMQSAMVHSPKKHKLVNNTHNMKVEKDTVRHFVTTKCMLTRCLAVTVQQNLRITNSIKPDDGTKLLKLLDIFQTKLHSRQCKFYNLTVYLPNSLYCRSSLSKNRLEKRFGQPETFTRHENAHKV